MAERLSKENFQNALATDKLVLIDFYSDSCVPCKRMSPVLAELEEEHETDLYVGKVNIAYESELVEQYEISSAPTFVFIKNGEVQKKISGVVKKAELENIIINL